MRMPLVGKFCGTLGDRSFLRRCGRQHPPHNRLRGMRGLKGLSWLKFSTALMRKHYAFYSLAVTFGKLLGRTVNLADPTSSNTKLLNDRKFVKETLLAM